MKKLIDLSIHDFCLELASSSPAPGGGSAAALAGALGAALASMVASLTIGKKKYLEVENDMLKLKTEAIALVNKYLQLIDEDTQAFNGVMAAYKLPKETDEEKSYRREQIQVATRSATETPLAMARHCVAILELCNIAAEKGNRNALSDAGVGAGMVEAAFRGAVYNVRINLSALKDIEFIDTVEAELRDLQYQVNEKTSGIYQAMERL